jgi:hypothetical protein
LRTLRGERRLNLNMSRLPTRVAVDEFTGRRELRNKAPTLAAAVRFVSGGGAATA